MNQEAGESAPSAPSAAKSDGSVTSPDSAIELKHKVTKREGISQNAEGKSQNELLHFAFCLLTFDFSGVFPLCLCVSNPDSG
jgi:hypothetical protein